MRKVEAGTVKTSGCGPRINMKDSLCTAVCEFRVCACVRARACSCLMAAAATAGGGE